MWWDFQNYLGDAEYKLEFELGYGLNGGGPLDFEQDSALWVAQARARKSLSNN